MNLAVDFFFKKVIFRRNFPEKLKKINSDAKILFFPQVFRRHHVVNDPVNFIDPTGLITEDYVQSVTTPSGQVKFGAYETAAGVAVAVGACRVPGIPLKERGALLAAGAVAAYDGVKNLQRGVSRSGGIDNVVREIMAEIFDSTKSGK